MTETWYDRNLVREFQYDTLGRNTAEIWYDTAADADMDASRQNTLSFAYDALGRMLSAGDQFAGNPPFTWTRISETRFARPRRCRAT